MKLDYFSLFVAHHYSKKKYQKYWAVIKKNFMFFLFICQYREYPCDHYTSVITVTLVMCGCPRVEVQTTALQLLQVLDKRFFGTTSVLQGEKEKGM